MGKQKYRTSLRYLIAWVVMIILFYAINLGNNIFYHILTQLFSVLVAYLAFFFVWKSKGYISNRYLIFLGTAYLFIGSFDLFHTIIFGSIGDYQAYDPNTYIQLYLIARYLESASFLIAALLLMLNKDNKISDSIIIRNSQFITKVFLIYTLVTACFLISVIYLKNFPICYIVGSGATPFYKISEYIVIFILIFSLILLYKQSYRFEKKVFDPLLLSLIFTFMAELPYLTYSVMDEFPRFVGLFFKTVSFYYLFVTYVEVGFELPFNLPFGKKNREDILVQEAAFLANERNYIYSLIGDKTNTSEKTAMKNSYEYEGDHRSFFQNFSGIQFQMDKDFLPILIEGPIEEITGYSKEDFLSRKVKWTDIIIPEDLPIISKKEENIKSNLNEPFEAEYRIKRKNGEMRWVIERSSQISGNMEKLQGSIYDITQRKKIEETLRKKEENRLREIHHRIKNNLQVISSLLDLQAEKFSDYKVCDNSKVIEAFKDSQNRVISMALIHEELYESKDMVTLNFANYLQKLAKDVLNSYTIKNQINLKLNLKQIYLGMDTAIPVGIIVNELITNSTKHAFPVESVRDEIQINLYEYENSDLNGYKFMLEVSDNGKGISEEIDIENSNSLGLQLVNILVEQIDGHLEVKNDKGTHFAIWFNDTEA